eukprot:3150959-Rhodomonas_salina.1
MRLVCFVDVDRTGTYTRVFTGGDDMELDEETKAAIAKTHGAAGAKAIAKVEAGAADDGIDLAAWRSRPEGHSDLRQGQRRPDDAAQGHGLP